MEKNNLDILKTYKNYLHLLEYRKEYGNKYGDTIELKKEFEKKLKIIDNRIIEK